MTYSDVRLQGYRHQLEYQTFDLRIQESRINRDRESLTETSQVFMCVKIVHPDLRCSWFDGCYTTQANLARLNLPFAEAVFEINYFRRNPVPCMRLFCFTVRHWNSYYDIHSLYTRARALPWEIRANAHTCEYHLRFIYHLSSSQFLFRLSSNSLKITVCCIHVSPRT